MKEIIYTKEITMPPPVGIGFLCDDLRFGIATKPNFIAMSLYK